MRRSGPYRGAEPSSAVAERSPGAVQRSPAAAQGEAHAGAEERLRLPRPTGPFRVGAETLHLTDHSRRDPWVPEAGDRELMVSLSYPARGGGAGRERPYLTGEEARLLVEFPERPGVDPARVAATRTHARTGARPAPGRFPLVLLSPGFTLPRATLTSLAEDLASRGYVVAAIDPAYESSGTAFPGGRTLTCVACERTDPETGDTSLAAFLSLHLKSVPQPLLDGADPAEPGGAVPPAPPVSPAPPVLRACGPLRGAAGCRAGRGAVPGGGVPPGGPAGSARCRAPSGPPGPGMTLLPYQGRIRRTPGSRGGAAGGRRSPGNHGPRAADRAW